MKRYVKILLVLLAIGIHGSVDADNILLTGYWPPTGGVNSMLTPFSNNPALNPNGWEGGNWEGLGYDVYAYFPTFPGGTSSNPSGVGDFEVDYQDTWNDFWAITDELNPIAIMSYGLGAGPWEIEFNARNLDPSSWNQDYSDPTRPDSRPDPDQPANHILHNTLPVQDIADAINEANLPSIGTSGAWVDWVGDPGGFLCEYMAYLSMHYHDMHSADDDPFQSFAAGFTHLSGNVTVEDATIATQIALRETIAYIDTFTPVPEPATILLIGTGLIGLAGLGRKKFRKT